MCFGFHRCSRRRRTWFETWRPLALPEPARKGCGSRNLASQSTSPRYDCVLEIWGLGATTDRLYAQGFSWIASVVKWDWLLFLSFDKLVKKEIRPISLLYLLLLFSE